MVVTWLMNLGQNEIAIFWFLAELWQDSLYISYTQIYTVTITQSQLLWLRFRNVAVYTVCIQFKFKYISRKCYNCHFLTGRYEHFWDLKSCGHWMTCRRLLPAWRAKNLQILDKFHRIFKGYPRDIFEKKGNLKVP